MTQAEQLYEKIVNIELNSYGNPRKSATRGKDCIAAINAAFESYYNERMSMQTGKDIPVIIEGEKWT